MKKKCNSCGEVKSLDGFHKKKDGKYGVCGICKECKRAVNREYEKERRERSAKKAVGSKKRLVGEAERDAAPNCNLCLVRDECMERVMNGMWLLCERPDEADLERVEALTPDLS